MEELKKCPFCGGEAMLKINYGFDERLFRLLCTAKNAESQREDVLQKQLLQGNGIGEWKND